MNIIRVTALNMINPLHKCILEQNHLPVVVVLVVVVVVVVVVVLVVVVVVIGSLDGNNSLLHSLPSASVLSVQNVCIGQP